MIFNCFFSFFLWLVSVSVFVYIVNTIATPTAKKWLFTIAASHYITRWKSLMYLGFNTQFYGMHAVVIRTNSSSSCLHISIYSFNSKITTLYYIVYTKYIVHCILIVCRFLDGLPNRFIVCQKVRITMNNTWTGQQKLKRKENEFSSLSSAQRSWSE